MDNATDEARITTAPEEGGKGAARKVFMANLLSALWPVLLVGAATLYLQAKIDAAAVELAERPRLIVVDDIALMEEAMEEGAKGSAEDLKRSFRGKLTSLMDDNTVVVSRYAVLAVSPGTLIESVPMKRDYAPPPKAAAGERE